MFHIEHQNSMFHVERRALCNSVAFQCSMWNIENVKMERSMWNMESMDVGFI